MFDRTVAMVENRGWLPYLRDNIAPHDMMLASFLTRILRPREERAPLEELMQHEYIASILAREQARIESALPAWRARVQAAGEVAKVVKLARAAEEVQHLLQQRLAARSGGTTTGSSSSNSNSNSSMGLASSDCSPSGSSSSIGSQVVPVQYNKPCDKSGSCNSTAEHSRRYSGDTSGGAADTADQLAGLDNSSSSSDINTRQPSKGWGSCSSSSSRTDIHAGDSTSELAEAMPALASLNQHQPQAIGTQATSKQVQAVSPQAAATALAESPSAMPGAACTVQQQQQAEPQPAGLSPCCAGVIQHQQQAQTAELQQQLHAFQQQRQELEREACLAAAWLAVQQQELQETQAALQELQQQVEAVEAANNAAQQQMAAYQQRLVVAVQPPSRPAAAAAADRVLPAGTAQGGRSAGGHWQRAALSICASCCGAAGTATNLRSHPIDIDMDDEDGDDYVY